MLCGIRNTFLCYIVECLKSSTRCNSTMCNNHQNVQKTYFWQKVPGVNGLSILPGILYSFRCITMNTTTVSQYVDQVSTEITGFQYFKMTQHELMKCVTMLCGIRNTLLHCRVSTVKVSAECQLTYMCQATVDQ